MSAIEKHSPQTKNCISIFLNNRFYMETKQPEKVASLLEDCEDDNVLASVSEYVCEAPEFKPEEEHTKRFRRLRSVRIRKVKSIIRRTEQIRLRRQGKNIKNLSYWKKKEQRRFALLL